MKQTNKLFFVLFIFLVAATGNVFSQKTTDVPKKDTSEAKEDDVTRLQSCDAFNSLEDGQPTPPGFLEFRMLPTYAYSKAEFSIFHYPTTK